MPRALILGGTGMIGRAAARRLLASGWQADLTGRDPSRLPADITDAGARFLTCDYHDGDQLKRAYGAGADLIVDCLCFTGRDAHRVLPFFSDATSGVMISSKAVYTDAAGHHVNSDEPPRFGGPVTEAQSTMAPGDGDYNTREGYGANKVAAERVLLDGGAPVTVLRPSKVHGEGSTNPREWVFLKRVLDGEREIYLARRGEGVDHTTAAVNIAALIEVAAARPGPRILNAADPDAPSALEISRAVARHMGHSWREILVSDDSAGRTPWDTFPPVVLDMTAAAGLGYVPVGDYAATVGAELDWLAAAAAAGDPAHVLPAPDDPYFAPFLAR